MQSNRSLLEINNLSISFHADVNANTVVNQISLHIEQGKTLGIVGESGSGKTVTALSILKLLPDSACIDAGEIWFTDKQNTSRDLLKTSASEIQNIRGNRIGMIFQEPMTSLNPVKKCGAQVAESMMVHNRLSNKEAKARTLEIFDEVLLPRPQSIYRSYPHQLSGGQKQRVMIAMAVACNPALLIADEPTTALDVTVQKSILALMRSLQEKYKMGILYITHDLGVVAQIADDVAVMYRGQVVEHGPVRTIFTNPVHPYTKGLIACRPGLKYRPEKLPVVSDFLNSVIEAHAHSFSFQGDEARLTRHKKIYCNEPLLSVENLKVYFTEKSSWPDLKRQYVKAVDDVSFEVYPGETLGLVGESGSGKTTLGRAILRLTEPLAGKIRFMEHELNSMKPKYFRSLRRHMQIIFQDPYSSLNPRIRIGDAIAEPVLVHDRHITAKHRKQKVCGLLERVGLNPEHYHRYPHEFSGGQRQRICIARALALNPKFIICDESVSALDVSIQAQVLNLLNGLKKDFGFTYIFISHDLSVVRYMSDRIMVMKNGKIVELGEADSVIANPSTDYTRSLISAIPEIAAEN